MNFDPKTAEYLRYYVYALIDPDDGKPFYIGKGKDNRVFSHVECTLKQETINDRYERIREIRKRDREVIHLILRHGMTEKVAYEVESTLIDFLIHLDFPILNKNMGHHTIDSGLLTANEIIRKYNAERLNELTDPIIMININKTYVRGSGDEGIYRATKESWVVDKNRIKSIDFVLSEYRGLIVEVFKIRKWYPVQAKDKNGKPKTRWGFDGEVAKKEIRDKYINKSVAHTKKRGSSNPIRYGISNA